MATRTIAANNVTNSCNGLPNHCDNTDTNGQIPKKCDAKIASGDVVLRRELGLPSAIGMAIGNVIGSGIFVMPKGAARGGGSVGLTLIMWTVAGVFTGFGALGTAELATMIPLSGGAYNYYKAAYGQWCGFLFCFNQLLMRSPSSMAIMSLTFSRYVMALFYEDGCGDAPDAIIKTLAVVVLVLVSAINCYSVRLAARIHVIASTGKVLALIMIVIGGIVWMAKGNIDNLRDGFSGTTTNAGTIAIGLYSCMFAFNGWDVVAIVCEEMKDPAKDMPRVAIVTTTLVTLLYVFTNMSYLVVMTIPELLDSPAVGVTWANSVMPRFAWILPVCVGLSTFGSINAATMATSRIHFVLARDRIWPRFLSMISVNNYTPLPSVLVSLCLSIFYVCVSTISGLLKFTSFLIYFFYALKMLAIFVLRVKMKNAPRPYKVNVIHPILHGVFVLGLCVVPLVMSPQIEFLYGTMVVLGGLVIFLYYTRLDRQHSAMDKITCLLQLLLQVSPQSTRDNKDDK